MKYPLNTLHSQSSYLSLCKWCLHGFSTFIFILLTSLVSVSSAENGQFSEGSIKAAYIFNFLRFVEWPEVPTNFDVCVLNPKKSYMSPFEALESQTLGGRKLMIEYLKAEELPTQLKQCHVLFVTDNDDGDQAMALNYSKDLPILTIGESSDFLENGGMVYLANRNNKIRFDISLDPVEQSDLRITSRILRLADNVIQ